MTTFNIPNASRGIIMRILHKDLRTGKYKMRVVRNKRSYTRKNKHKNREI